MVGAGGGNGCSGVGVRVAVAAEAGRARLGDKLGGMAKVVKQASWLRVPPEEDAPAGVQALFDKANEKLGFVPNVLRVYALRPRHLELWNAFYDELMRGESALTKVQREMIAVVVSTVNRCHYCMVSHSAFLRKLTGDPLLVEQLRTNYAYADIEPRERAMLDFAVKLTERSSACTEEDVEALREAGWTRRGRDGHRRGGGDVQLHEPAGQRPRLGSERRVRHPRLRRDRLTCRRAVCPHP